MTILSDRAIQDLIARNMLIADGDPEAARYGSYRFTAAKIFHGGGDGPTVDFTGETDHDVIEPGEFVWIRMKELIKLPDDICAFWWQTNHLSRKGLLLMNMSVIEPGYEGPLSCLFVNFSKAHVVLHPGTTLAKVVFVKLDGDVDTPSRKVGLSDDAVRRYDASVKADAVQRPSRFFRLAEIFEQMEAERKRTIADFGKEADELLTRKKIQFTKDIPKSIRDTSLVAGGALAILLLISAVTPVVRDYFGGLVEQKPVAEQVREELRNWVVLPPSADEGTLKTLKAAAGERDDLKRRLAEMEARLAEMQARLEEKPVPASAQE
ncbi:MAG: dCTP deaminase domain-containing protein [Alphaproteobacteria bacterium]